MFINTLWRCGLSIFFIVGLNFFIIHLLPGDPLVHLVGEETYFHLQGKDPEALNALRSKYGLDKPVLHRFGAYLARMATFDLGWSRHWGKPVSEIVVYRMGWTLVLLCPAVFLSSLLGLLAACLVSRPGGRTMERLTTPFMLTIYSVPTYCLAFLLLALVTSMGNGVPLGGMRTVSGTEVMDLADVIRHMALPSAVLVLHTTAYLYMLMRGSMRRILASDYVLTAVSKGLWPSRIVRVHVLKNALPPYIAAMGVHFGAIAGGALLVEVVFSWQGMGTLMFDGVMARDYALLSGCFVLLSFAVIGANLVADLLCRLIDPRMGRQGDDV